MRIDILRTVKKPLLSIFLAVIMVLGPCAMTAEAFSLEVPETTYEDYQAYDGIKMFLNGRYVEFNDETGYPYIENGTMMISLAAIEKGLGGHTELKTGSERILDEPEDLDESDESFYRDFLFGELYHKYTMAVISKHDRGVQFKDNEVTGVRFVYMKNENGSSKIETVAIRDSVMLDVGVTLKGEVPYVPLRPLFETFGLAIRWEQETQTVHIEVPEPANAFPNIDFKDAEVISVQELDTDAYKTLLYDGQVVDASYIPLLKNSNQYKVVLADDTAYIFSYQYLSDLNYLYGKVKDFKSSTEPILLYRPSEEETDFFKQAYFLVPLTTDELPLSGVGSSLRVGADSSLRSWFFSRVHITEKDLNALLEEVQRIAVEIQKQTSDPREQAILATQILHREIRYSGSINGQGAYTALVKKEAVCGGFSDALQFILEELGIPVMQAGGARPQKDGTYVHHGWNHVYVEGEWYLFDATWGVWMKPLNFHKQFIRSDEEIATEQLMVMTYRF